MKNKLVFRILGALASALIIASVFIPFISVTGYSQSLWQGYESVGTLYLPIMIIVFGAFGVLVFSTGFKTELAYASAGGLVFFLITQTIPIIDQGTFDTMGVGYYCLTIGTLLIIIMAFLCGLRVKQKVVENSPVEETKEVSMIDQIDKLYNDQSTNQTVSDTNGLDNIIQPIPVGGSIPSNPIPVENQISQQVITENNIQPVVAVNQPLSHQNLSSQSSVSTTPEVTDQILNDEATNIGTPVQNNVTISSNPVVSDFNVTTQNSVGQSNPVVAEFNGSVSTPEQSVQQSPVQSNPVVAEFSQSASAEPQQPVQQPSLTEVADIAPIQPISSEKKVDVMAEPTNNSSNLDIFG